MGAIYIALGANLSNKKASFIKALNALKQEGADIVAVSGLWQSPSWPPGQGQPDYLNSVAEIHWSKTPAGLLSCLHQIEADAGRVRSVRNAPRPLDLDILDFKGETLTEPTLTLPHPRMLSRGFVLFPLSQIAPDWHDPVSGNHLDHFIARLPLKEVAPMEYKGRFW